MAAKRVAGGTNSGRAPKAQAGKKNKKNGEHAKNRIEQRPTNAKSDGSEEDLYVFVLSYDIGDVNGDAGPAEGGLERHRNHRVMVAEQWKRSSGGRILSIETGRAEVLMQDRSERPRCRGLMRPARIRAGTHHLGFDRDQRNGKVTHRIDPNTDGEREFIAQSLREVRVVVKTE